MKTPNHYIQSKITPIDLILDWQLNFFLGNVVKYICRAPYKGNALEDLKKAQHYLAMEIDILENGTRTTDRKNI